MIETIKTIFGIYVAFFKFFFTVLVVIGMFYWVLPFVEEDSFPRTPLDVFLLIAIPVVSWQLGKRVLSKISFD